MNKYYFAAALLGLSGSSLFAASVNYAFLNSESGTQNVYQNEAISPYSGATGTSSTEANDAQVQLFCDDFTDNSIWGTSWQAYITPVNSSNLTDTRFGTHTSTSNTTYPSGTALYEQAAWLFTQELAPNQTTANVDAIQEAVWEMTAPKGTTTPTGAPGISGWITAAQTYYLDTAAQTPSMYEAVTDYSRWTIVTDTNTIGMTSGKINSSGSANQEFLAYTPSGGIPGTGGQGATPEPATFVLFGSALCFIGLAKRPRKAVQR